MLSRQFDFTESISKNFISLLSRLRNVLFFLFLFIDALVHPFRLSTVVKNRSVRVIFCC
uniref:Uncharacterized protein n=1 Tax=Solanum lycopersicum TaxID=4081 RepID=A0A3Q7HJ56_SOLLC